MYPQLTLAGLQQKEEAPHTLRVLLGRRGNDVRVSVLPAAEVKGQTSTVTFDSLSTPQQETLLRHL